jgi:polyphosphate kinase 2 PPK2
MPKDKDHKGDRGGKDTPTGAGRDQAEKPKLKCKDYEDKLRELHVRLSELQDWVRHEGHKVCIVFEGRDGAGKGGAIKAISARVSPRVFRGARSSSFYQASKHRCLVTMQSGREMLKGNPPDRRETKAVRLAFVQSTVRVCR